MSNGLDVVLRKNPTEWSPENDDRYLDIGFSFEEWDSFFYKTLAAANSDQFEREPVEDYWTRRKCEFHDSLADYPLLRRIDDYYQDAYFTADEIDQLVEELNRAATLSSDSDSDAFLTGMLKACNEAKAINTGIWLASS